MNRLFYLLHLSACLGPAAAMAADFDGSKPLICAPAAASEVRAGEKVDTTRPSDIGAPSFLRVDVARKTIAGPKRVTPIRHIEKSEEQILLQGTELGFGWTIAIDQKLGEMTITFVDRFGAVVLSGSCTPI